MAAFTNIMGRPRMIKLLIALEDNDTIKWLDFVNCCHNFKMIKNVALITKGSWEFCLSLAEPTAHKKYINTTNLRRIFLMNN